MVIFAFHLYLIYMMLKPATSLFLVEMFQTVEKEFPALTFHITVSHYLQLLQLHNQLQSINLLPVGAWPVCVDGHVTSGVSVPLDGYIELKHSG